MLPKQFVGPHIVYCTKRAVCLRGVINRYQVLRPGCPQQLQLQLQGSGEAQHWRRGAGGCTSCPVLLENAKVTLPLGKLGLPGCGHCSLNAAGGELLAGTGDRRCTSVHLLAPVNCWTLPPATGCPRTIKTCGTCNCQVRDADAVHMMLT